MRKLLDFKNWMTVADAAKYLSILFVEDVSEADVLQLALDGHLRLSVNFVNNAVARHGEIIPWEETEWLFVPLLTVPGFPAPPLAAGNPETERILRNPPPKLKALIEEVPADERGQCYPLCTSLKIDSTRYLRLTDRIGTLTGVWDLAMIGSEQLSILREYQHLTRGPSVTLVELDGAFVEDESHGLWQLQGSDDDGAFGDEEKPRAANRRYFPDDLPDDAVFVVRTAVLRDFGRQDDDVRSPNGSRAHLSDKLAFMNQAASRFWSNADREDRATHPENAKVAAWLVDRGFSQTLADKAATIIRPEWAPTGRKPEE